jgi:hypothetical protein
MHSATNEILEFISALNHCWTFGDPADLKNFFHPEMLAVTPMDSFCLVGATACVAGWARFRETTVIKSWTEANHIVRNFGNAAVVAYTYEIAFSMNGKDYCEQGRDLFFLIHENGRWQVVADQFSPVPKN